MVVVNTRVASEEQRSRGAEEEKEESKCIS